MLVPVGTNGWDVLTFGIPSMIAAGGAIIAAYWARGARTQAQSAKDEVKSPNGGTTGQAVEDLKGSVAELSRSMLGMRSEQAEFKESVRASRILTAEVQTELRRFRDDLSDQIGEVRQRLEDHENGG